MNKSWLTALATAWWLALTLCGCGEEGETHGGGSGGGHTTEQCEARLSVLQKDAYKETAGRSSPLWPPHTTTEVVVSCASGGDPASEVDRAFQSNHGTEPGDVDANGDLFLEEVHSDSVFGTRAELLALLDAYRGCSCDGVTQFLSLDALQDAAVQELVDALVGYISDHLTCNGGTDTAGFIALLQQGAIEEVLAILPDCVWEGGTDLGGGLDAALDEILAQGQEVLANYHVCNNDAALQGDLFTRYASDGSVAACNADVPMCRGPLWFYNP